MQSAQTYYVTVGAAVADSVFGQFTTWGEHVVTDISQAADPECIYFGQAPAIQIGDIFSFRETTQTNGWGVSIDSQGFPVIDSGGATGADSFLFNVSRDSGATWDPVPPARDSWPVSVAILLSLTDIAYGFDLADIQFETEGDLVLSPISSGWSLADVAVTQDHQLAVGSIDYRFALADLSVSQEQDLLVDSIEYGFYLADLQIGGEIGDVFWRKSVRDVSTTLFFSDIT